MTNMYKNLIVISLLASACYSLTAFSNSLDLKLGTVVNDATVDDLATNSIPYAVARCGWGATCDDNAVDVIAFTNLGSGDIYYSFGRDMKIRSFNLAVKSDFGNWSLIRTDDDSQQKIAQLSASNDRDQTGEYDFVMGTENPQSLGCLWDYPLRYGDVHGDGQTELVLLPGEGEFDARTDDTRLDFLIFSLQSHAVIFSIRLAREDIGESIAEYDPNYKQKSDYAQFPQILDIGGYGTAAAVRYYAKLYFDDFNGDGKPDIIAWRKRYVSRNISDSVKGYKLADELLTYYELNNGVYKAQTTDETTIKGWLAAKSLTWQKGYPQTSECAGQTGQPIPEMVDPLLNDPDVLK